MTAQMLQNTVGTRGPPYACLPLHLHALPRILYTFFQRQSGYHHFLVFKDMGRSNWFITIFHITSTVGPKHGQVKSLHVPQGGLHKDNYSIMWFELYDNWIWANEGQSFVGQGAALKLNSVRFHSGFSTNEQTGEIIHESCRSMLCVFLHSNFLFNLSKKVFCWDGTSASVFQSNLGTFFVMKLAEV